MGEWFATGHVALAILFLMAIEAVVLFGIRVKSRRGPTPLAIAASLGAGAALLLALRAALLQLAWPIIAFWLVGALIAHVCDLSVRFAGPGTKGS